MLIYNKTLFIMIRLIYIEYSYNYKLNIEFYIIKLEYKIRYIINAKWYIDEKNIIQIWNVI